MAKAKKLPSGNYRCLAYSHSETVLDSSGAPVLDQKGKPKKKRIYESFTAETKKEAEFLAAEFELNKKLSVKPKNMTLKEAIDKYIDSSDGVLSPTTISGYRKIQGNAFQDIMNIRLSDLSNDVLKRSVNAEAKRPSKKNKKNPKPISPKTVSNEYGLITAVLNHYHPSLNCNVKLPARERKIKELIPAETIFEIVKGTDIELPVLLAMWLSFSLSEIRGLTKSNSISNGYIVIHDVIVDVDGTPTRKEKAKAFTRIRKHRIPPYIQTLIDNTDPDVDELVTLSGHAVYMRFKRLLEQHNLPHMTFHDLRHLNASIMALLQIPEQYAMERGGWKSSKTMKNVYTHTFSRERTIVDDTIDGYFDKICNTKCNTKK